MATQLQWNSQWMRRFGVRPGNPIGIIALIAFGIAILGTLGLVIAFIFTSETHQKLGIGYALIFFSSLAPIPVGLLVLWSRNIARAQDAALGNYWAHWQYTPRELYEAFLPRNVDEVYIHPNGVYYPAQNLRPRSFSSGLSSVEITPGKPATLVLNYILKHRSQYGYVYYKEVKQITLPIPKGKEDEAEALAARFKSEGIGKPSEFTNDSWLIGWMMAGAIIGAVLLTVLLVLPVEFRRITEDSQATSTAVAERRATEAYTLSIQLDPVRPALERVINTLLEESRSPEVGWWQTVDASKIGFNETDNIARVIYGYCASDGEFYFFAQEKTPSKTTYGGRSGAFAYSTGQNRYTCPPEGLRVSSVTAIDGDWYYVNLEADLSVLIGTLTAIAPTPTR